MSRIRGKNTKPELVVRSFLHRNGFRYRIHQSTLPGKPDVVLSRYKTVIFVHGCFWHGCPKHSNPQKWIGRSSMTASPSPVKRRTGRTFWMEKLCKNMARDRWVNRVLRQAGWRVVRIWEHDLARRRDMCAHRIQTVLLRSKFPLAALVTFHAVPS